MEANRSEFQRRDFAYLVNGYDLAQVTEYARSKGGYIGPGYTFVDEEREHVEFDEMMKLAVAGDTVYVPTIKVFIWDSMHQFISELERMEDKGLRIVSLSEPDYECGAYTAAIDVVSERVLDFYVRGAQELKEKIQGEIAELVEQKEDLLHRGGRPRKEVQTIEALALYRTGRFRIEEICNFTELSKSSLFRALADAEDSEDEEQEN